MNNNHSQKRAGNERDEETPPPYDGDVKGLNCHNHSCCSAIYSNILSSAKRTRYKIVYKAEKFLCLYESILLISCS